MKNTITSLTLLILFQFTSFAQEQEALDKMQIGLTGLPIVYVNNGEFALDGLALYGNLGWFFKTNQVVGFRPFFGRVETDFERAHSLGSNVYYRNYFNEGTWRFFMDANLGFGYIWHKQKIEQILPLDLDGVLFNFAAGLGTNWAFHDQWNLEILVQYLQMRNLTHPGSTITGNAIIPSIGIQRFF